MSRISSAWRGPRRTLAIVALVAVATMLATAWLMREPARAAGPPAAAAGVPVETSIVSRETVPVYLEGLGTVQAFYTVTITARVDGQLDKVGLRRGPDCQARDSCWRRSTRGPIRPRSIRRVATEAKDRAQLAERAGATWSATCCSPRRTSPASRPWTRSRRWSRSCRRRSRATRRPSTTPVRSSTTPPSARRSTAAPASG